MPTHELTSPTLVARFDAIDAQTLSENAFRNCYPLASGIALSVLGAITLDLHDEFLGPPSQDDPRAVPLQEEGRQLALATDVMVGVTSVAAAAAVVLAIFTRWGSAPSSGGQARGLSLAPMAGGGLAAALVF